VTLGSDEDALPERFPDETKGSIGRKAFLHYDFPPYSVNEIGKVFGANRYAPFNIRPPLCIIYTYVLIIFVTHPPPPTR
jgi:hypothetical protein